MLPFQDDPEMFSHFPTLVIGQTLTPVRVEARDHMHKNESSAEQGLERFKCVSARFCLSRHESSESEWDEFIPQSTECVAPGYNWGELTATRVGYLSVTWWAWHSNLIE